MSLLALAMVLLSAGVHAGWNALAKRSGEPLVFLWLLNAVGVLLAAVPVARLWPAHPPPAAGWRFVAASGALHVLYYAGLGRAYARSDLSLAYPIARGTGLLLTPLLAVPLLGDRPTPGGWVGIALIVAGVLGLHGPALAAIRRRAGARALISLPALLTGLVIAGYSLNDAAGARRVQPVIYLWLIEALVVLALGPYLLGRRRPAVVAELVARPGAVLVAGAGAFATYVTVLTALRLAPVGYVVPVREVSIVIGALIGARWLGEPFGRTRLLASLVIVAGVAVIAAAG